MNLAEMLRGNPLAQQRLADNFAMNKQGDLARMMQQHGTVQDPARVQEPQALGNLPMDVPQPTQQDMLTGAEQVMNLMPQAGIFAGVGSKTANKLALQKAQEMAGQGVDRNKIWNDTGWYNDVDKQWKYEIDDSGMRETYPMRDNFDDMQELSRSNPKDYKRLNRYENMIAQDVTAKQMQNKSALQDKLNVFPYEKNNTVEAGIKHNNLFEAYPALQQYGYGTSGAGVGNRGLLDGKEIRINRDMLNNVNRRSTPLHELQHGVQHEERFATGGSPAQFQREIGGVNDEITGHNMRMSWLAREMDKMKEVGSFERHDELKAQYDKLMDDKLSRLVPQAQKDPFEQYKRLAGEAEARNVQKRMDFTPAQRQAQPPWETLDVPENELLVRMLTGR